MADSKILAMTMVDLLLRADLVAPAKTNFIHVQLKNTKVLPLLGENDQPQIQMNREVMERFRPRCANFITTRKIRDLSGAAGRNVSVLQKPK